MNCSDESLRGNSHSFSIVRRTPPLTLAVNLAHLTSILIGPEKLLSSFDKIHEVYVNQRYVENSFDSTNVVVNQAIELLQQKLTSH